MKIKETTKLKYVMGLKSFDVITVKNHEGSLHTVTSSGQFFRTSSIMRICQLGSKWEFLTRSGSLYTLIAETPFEVEKLHSLSFEISKANGIEYSFELESVE